ncbi:MAG: autoinducer-2 kinase [Sulfurimonas sp. RIFOXYD12_FULL_33_39]|uniref:autoinducer-2 kinase n=1 Tax=unclassified Sulfurimonas TaxID=2623549 RepID=UPI0008D3A1AC|nr:MULTISPECIES: autoinducer-2 kinase [unclassified Sulfurimonas]OHE09133.1 MAG: autoinducer-2 kinase [Sulfurimonas sp. RIFOXYD12_FULL_33_39]OHE14450.1 MAG: autoinducer-2 kinase [Sulfurimonas sp. RIFOXYD2_FULL_34_21]DAB28619.1 MAG TPA: autoinducer-2 kinase [Sulfurimonas sp. UBA10385]
MQYLMAIDAGTGSIRAVIFDTLGNQISVAQQEWTHLEEDGVPNSMNFDFDANWLLTCKCIRESLEAANLRGEDILALSATSMREGIVLYDKEGRELWAVANVDARASDEVRYLKENFVGIEEEFYSESGQTFALGAIPRIMWLKNNRPDMYERVAKISMIGDWILYKLCKVIATDPSNGGTTGIFSLKNRNWVSDMSKRVGLKDDIFGEVLEVGTLMGSVSKEASLQTTLSTCTKVVMGGGDVQLGCAGLGVVDVGQVAILGGSFWQQVVNIDKNTLPPSDMNIRVNPHVISSQSQAEGITFFSGLVMRWFRDAFCDMEKLEAKERGVDVYAVLEEKASKVPVGSYGILPIFSDSMKYSKWYHAAPSFLNLSINPSTCNRASMFRSLQENAAIVSSINLDKIKEFADIKIDEIVFAGGASKGALWSQILADVTGCSVKIPRVTEATALGGAMAAAVGVGIYKDIADAAKKIVVWDKVYKPNLENKKVYDEIKIKFEKAYEVQLKLVDDNITTSMWKAPGL